MAVGPRGTADVSVTGKGGTIKLRLRVRPLPPAVTDFLTGNSAAIKELVRQQQQHDAAAADDLHPDAGDTTTGRDMTADELRAGLRTAFAEAAGWHADDADRIVAFGPRRLGPNVLLDATPERRLGKPVFKAAAPQGGGAHDAVGDTVAQAFQLAAQQGPLCHEPLQGVAVSVATLACSGADVDVDVDVTALAPTLLKALRAALPTALLEFSPRLRLATLVCSVAAPDTALGRVYDVLAKRRAHVVSETLSERTNTYAVTAMLALRESFGFADELRARTSGAAAVELAFGGFETLEDEDPFWVPRTEEELEDLGDTADRENRTRALVDEVRRRKGMLVAGRKGLLDAEKERNLKR
jgi:ribosome assembly protein 1